VALLVGERDGDGLVFGGTVEFRRVQCAQILLSALAGLTVCLFSVGRHDERPGTAQDGEKQI
jgi:hypothetical protein